MIPGSIYLTILFTLIVGAVQGEMMRRNQTVGTTFSVWLAVTGVLGYTAKLHDFSQRPPRIMALIALSVAGVYFGSYFVAARKLIESPGLAWLIGLQVFRVAVEIFLDLGIPRGICSGADDIGRTQLGRTDGIDGVTDGMAGGETKSAAMADLCMEHDGTGAVVECDGGCCVFDADAATAFSE